MVDPRVFKILEEAELRSEDEFLKHIVDVFLQPFTELQQYRELTEEEFSSIVEEKRSELILKFSPLVKKLFFGLNNPKKSKSMKRRQRRVRLESSINNR